MPIRKPLFRKNDKKSREIRKRDLAAKNGERKGGRHTVRAEEGRGNERGYGFTGKGRRAAANHVLGRMPIPRRSNKNRTLPGIVWKARPRARSIYAKKRPARCKGTISPDTFHLTDRANHRLTWSVFQTFAEIYGCQSASLQCPQKKRPCRRVYTLLRHNG